MLARERVRRERVIKIKSSSKVLGRMTDRALFFSKAPIKLREMGVLMTVDAKLGTPGGKDKPRLDIG